jgi:hypothetical protein
MLRHYLATFIATYLNNITTPTLSLPPSIKTTPYFPSRTHIVVRKS